MKVFAVIVAFLATVVIASPSGNNAAPVPLLTLGAPTSRPHPFPTESEPVEPLEPLVDPEPHAPDHRLGADE
jgi:hypothetical protein